MATLTVWSFDTATGAENALETLERLQRDKLITLQDAAVVTWPTDRSKPKTRQLRKLVGVGALGGAFWGFLFGLIFFVPVFGMAVGAAVGAGTAVGAAAGAGTGLFRDVGIDDDFIERVRARVTPGTSALFVLTSGVVLDEVTNAFEDERGHAELIETSLSAEEAQKLRDAFAEEETPALAVR